MRKVKILRAAATAYLVCGIILLLGTDTSMVYGFLSLVCFMGAWGYDNAASIRHQDIINELNDLNHD